MSDQESVEERAAGVIRSSLHAAESAVREAERKVESARFSMEIEERGLAFARSHLAALRFVQDQMPGGKS